MNKIAGLILILTWFSACNKHNHHFDHTANTLSVLIAADTGAVFTRPTGDTFLIHLKNPEGILNRVPLVYILPEGARSSAGDPVSAVPELDLKGGNNWADFVDLRDNKIYTVTVTSASGNIARYVIAFEYDVQQHIVSYTSGHINNLFFDGDRLYAATEAGLFLSTDEASSFIPLGAFGSSDKRIHSVYARGNTLFVGTSDGLAISGDGGKTFSTRVFAAMGKEVNNGHIVGVTGIDVQGNTIYTSTGYGGVFISRDGGISWDSVWDGLRAGNDFPVVQRIRANGSNVYAATVDGLAVSTDGGRHFTLNDNLKDTAGKRPLCFDIFADKGIVYVAALSGLYQTADGGKSFTLNSKNPTGGGGYAASVCAQDGLIAVAWAGGLTISRDGGLSNFFFSSNSGLPSILAQAVLVKGNTIYCGDGAGSWVTVLKPR